VGEREIAVGFRCRLPACLPGSSSRAFARLGGRGRPPLPGSWRLQDNGGL